MIPTPIIRDTREEAAADVHALHDVGRAATLYGPVAGRFLALDLDAPVVDVTDALFDLGLGSDHAADEALRLVAAGS